VAKTWHGKSEVMQKVYKKRIKDIDELRARIMTAWDKMDQRIIDKAVRQWRTRLCACIDQIYTGAQKWSH